MELQRREPLAIPGPALWWAQVKARGRYPLGVVLGPRRIGKTTWFEQLAADPGEHLVVWPVIRAARLKSAEQVWAQVWQVLGFPAPDPRDDPLEYLELALETLGHPLTLVVDEWDRAIDPRSASTSEACYEVLDSLARFCLDQARDRARTAVLGLLLLTSVPAVADLQYFARDAQRSTFERLSQLITRSFATETFPLLDRAASEDLLIARGLSQRTARRVAQACGGWLWLLQEAADAVLAAGSWNAEVSADLRDRVVPVLVQESLLVWLAYRPVVRTRGVAPIDYLAEELAAGVSPSDFGLPQAFDDPAQPAPLIRQCLVRSYLVVDVESLRMPFQKHWAVYPQAYPEGLYHFLQQHAGSWLAGLQERHAVAGDDVLLVGRSDHLIDDTVGARFPGRRYFLPDALRKKGDRKGDHSDDTLLTALVARLEARHRLARFVLVTGDQDQPLILDLLGALRNVTVCTPWQASRAVREQMPHQGQVVENTFPVPRPPRAGHS